MTFQAYLQQTYTPQTVDSYTRSVNHFLFHTSSKKQINYTEIVSYLSKHKKNSPRNVAAIKVYFSYLIITGKRKDHPCKGLKIRRENSPVQFQELFTPNELKTLLERKERYNLLKTRNKAILSLLIFQGLTAANIENLKVKDINFDEGTIYLRSTKTTNRRTLELKPKQILQLYNYIHTQRNELMKTPTESVFLGKLGTSYKVNSLNAMLRPLQSVFPYKNLNATTIRKSVIANWLNVEKIPLEDVQLLAGHKWIASTEKYIRPDMKEKRGLINQFFPIN